MKSKFFFLGLALLTASFFTTSCSLSVGEGDIRERNIEKSMLKYIASHPAVSTKNIAVKSGVRGDNFASNSKIEYVGLADCHEVTGGRFEGMIVYFATDSLGHKAEHNVRIVTNFDGKEIYSWDELDTKIVAETKEQMSEKMKEEGLPIDGSVIDAILKLKRLTR